MNRRSCIKALLSGIVLCPELLRSAGDTGNGPAISADELDKLAGDLTLYLGRGEGGLYTTILDAIRERNPDLNLDVRRGPSSALANTLVAEAKAGGPRADLFWAIDASSLGVVTENVSVPTLPSALHERIKPEYRYATWAPVSGRIRSIPYNTDRLKESDIPKSIMSLAESDLRIGWAPAYGAFQSFVTAMRLLEGEEATRDWLRAIKPRATKYAGEFGVVMAVARGEVDVGFANHYYTLRLKKGKPKAAVDMAFTQNDAGCLLNASGAALMRPSELATLFIRYLLTREVQSYLAREAYEIPLVTGVKAPDGLPPLSEIRPPKVDLEKLGDLRPTLRILRSTGVL